MKLLGVILTLITGGPWAFAAPPWFKDATKLSYPKYSVTCSASGPSLEQARKQALSNCRSSAIDQLPTITRFKSTVIETESAVALHSESETNVAIKNLHCVQRKEQIEETESSFTAYILCDFDLSKTELTEADVKSSPHKTAAGLEQFAEKPVDYSEAERIPASSRSISISTVPQCQDILVRGKKARIVRCTENPISVIFSEADTEIVIRKNGFRSKTVGVNEIIHSKDENHVFPLDPL